ncbi:MAG: DUF6703 family protein [Actinomycetota bacterium]
MRRGVERASLPLLTHLSKIPTLVAFLIVVIPLVFGVVVGGTLGAVCTGVVTLLAGWFLYLGWPLFTTIERWGRAAIFVVAAAMTTAQIFGP